MTVGHTPETRNGDTMAEQQSRPWTPEEQLPDGGRRITMKRACNGCGRRLGDVTSAEMDAAIEGRPLPDVRDECGCSSSPIGSGSGQQT
jgi:hypothetical protein